MTPSNYLTNLPKELCPLQRTGFIDWSSPQELRKIERHINEDECSFDHPPLKEVLLHGPLEGSTPLAQACSGADDFEAAKIIIEEWGVGVDNLYHRVILFEDNYQNYPLLAALRSGNINIAKYLIKKGSDFDELIEALVDLKQQLSPILTWATLRASLELVSEIDQDPAQMWTCDLISIVAQLSPESITHETMCYLHRLVQDKSLLLTICSQSQRFDELASTVRLLLKAGADPMASDWLGNNALHFLAGVWLEEDAQAADLDELLADVIRRCKDCCKGSLYQVNAVKDTPSDIWRKQNAGGIERILPSSLNKVETVVPSLICLSARVVRRAEISYDGDSLPVKLHPVVAKH